MPFLCLNHLRVSEHQPRPLLLPTAPHNDSSFLNILNGSLAVFCFFQWPNVLFPPDFCPWLSQYPCHMVLCDITSFFCISCGSLYNLSYLSISQRNTRVTCSEPGTVLVPPGTAVSRLLLNLMSGTWRLLPVFSRIEYSNQLYDRVRGNKSTWREWTRAGEGLCHRVVQRRARWGRGDIWHLSCLKELAFQSCWAFSDPHTTFNKSVDETNICRMKEERG